MKRTVEYLGKTEDGFAEYEISESYEDDATATVYQSEKIPRPTKARAELSNKKGFLELNKEEFLKTEFGIELKKTVEALVYIHTLSPSRKNRHRKAAKS